MSAIAESLNDALIECVKAGGRSKKVGVELWPTKGVEKAQQHLLACLNPERNEKLSLDEIIALMRVGRENGCHAAIDFLMYELGYAETEPVEPIVEMADIQLQAAVKAEAVLSEMSQMLARMEKLASRASLKAAA